MSCHVGGVWIAFGSRRGAVRRATLAHVRPTAAACKHAAHQAGLCGCCQTWTQGAFCAPWRARRAPGWWPHVAGAFELLVFRAVQGGVAWVWRVAVAFERGWHMERRAVDVRRKRRL